MAYYGNSAAGDYYPQPSQVLAGGADHSSPMINDPLDTSSSSGDNQVVDQQDVEVDDGLRAPFAKNPTFGLVPLSASEVYKDRLKGWAEVVKRLITHFEVVLDQEKKMADLCNKCVKDLSSPIRMRPGGAPVFGEKESLQILFGELFDSQIQRAAQHASAAQSIETQTLPNLKTILQEIKAKHYALDKDWISIDKELARDRETYLKLTRHLTKCLERQKWVSQSSLDDLDGSMSSLDVKETEIRQKDPWLANMQVKKFINQMLSKQDYVRQTIINQQQDVQVFEQVVIMNIKDTLSNFFSLRSRSLTTHKEAVSQLFSFVENVHPATDWTLFRESRKDVIINPDDPESTKTLRFSDIPYDGRDDPRTLAVKEGIMLRNIPGVLRNRGHQPGVYVLTASGHLHGFHPSTGVYPEGYGPEPGPEAVPHSAETLIMNAEPDLSIYLCESTIGARGTDPKDPHEFTITEKSGGGFFGGGGKHKLKAPTADQSDFWHDLIVSLSKPPVPRANSISRDSADIKRASTGSTPSTSSTTSPRRQSKPVPTSSTSSTTTSSSTTAVKQANPGPRLSGPGGSRAQQAAAVASASAAATTTAIPQTPVSPHSQEVLFNADDVEEEDEDSQHPSVAAALRGRVPPADLLALKQGMTGGSGVSGLGSTSSLAGPLPGNEWDDGAAAAWGDGI